MLAIIWVLHNFCCLYKVIFNCSLVYCCVVVLFYWALHFCIPQSLYLQFLLLCHTVLDPLLSLSISETFQFCILQILTARLKENINQLALPTSWSIKVWDCLGAVFVPLKSFYVETKRFQVFVCCFASFSSPAFVFLLDSMSAWHVLFSFCLLRHIFKGYLKAQNKKGSNEATEKEHIANKGHRCNSPSSFANTYSFHAGGRIFQFH